MSNHSQNRNYSSGRVVPLEQRQRSDLSESEIKYLESQGEAQMQDIVAEFSRDGNACRFAGAHRVLQEALFKYGGSTNSDSDGRSASNPPRDE